MYDLKQNKLQPQFVGCFGKMGYIHDAQCINHPTFESEVCFAYTGSGLVIIDVGDKSNVKVLSSLFYDAWGYVHQGWITEDLKYLIVDDEADNSNKGTVTFVIDVEMLERPALINIYHNEGQNFQDHNQYVMGNYTYQANYAGGLHVLRIVYENNQFNHLEEVANFDTSHFTGNSFNGKFLFVFIVCLIVFFLFVLTKITFKTD